MSLKAIFTKLSCRTESYSAFIIIIIIPFDIFKVLYSSNVVYRVLMRRQMKRCQIQKHNGSNHVVFLVVSEHFKIKVQL